MTNNSEHEIADTAKPDSHSLLICVCLIASMGGLLFGYDWVVIGGAKPFFSAYFGITSNPDLVGLAMSCALAGCLVGALASGLLSDRYGRKKLLVVAAILFVISAPGTGLAIHLSEFVFYRVLGGIGIGLASNLSPIYIAEVSPAKLRGSLVAINQFTINLGLVSAQLVNWLLVSRMPQGFTNNQILGSWYGQIAWRWMFATAAIPAILFLALLIFVPESPRWLVKTNRIQRAARVLSSLGGWAYSQTEIRNIQASLSSSAGDATELRMLLRPRVIRIIVIGMVLATLQQWCGMNAIFFYSEDIFRSAGYNINGVMLNILLTGVTSVLFTIAAILMVDRWGRRPLMLLGTGGIGVLLALFGTGFRFGITGVPMLAIVLITMALYAFTLAPIMWVLLAEMFPNRIRGTALSISVATLWITCWALAQFFPRIRLQLGEAGSFWMFACICMLGFLFVWHYVPETKGKSLEELETELLAPEQPRVASST